MTIRHRAIMYQAAAEAPLNTEEFRSWLAFAEKNHGDYEDWPALFEAWGESQAKTEGGS